MPGGRRTKSIYGRVKKFAEARAAPVMVHGEKLSTELYGVTERVVNPRLNRIKATVDTLKLSAAHAGSYSLSANQIGISNAIFVMHKELLDRQASAFLEKRWLHPDAYAVQEQTQLVEEEDGRVSLSGKQLLDPTDYQTFLNPRVLEETSHRIIDWEHCLSFPSVRCMVKRPQGILINYLDETGGEHEHKMFDFTARVFLHELDHIEGRTMTHWKISEGNIDIIPGNEDRNRHLMTTVDFYKEKITEMKQQFEDDLFAEKRPFEEVVDEDDGDVWKRFKSTTRKETMLDALDLDKAATQAPAIEETMLLDTIRAMRRDRKDHAKELAKQRRK